MKNIVEVAKNLDLSQDDLFCYGNYMAKVNKNYSPNTNSKLILVTAINPTPYGEGKTTVSIGLDDALCKIGKKSVAVLREPSLGPVFGMKGGATGGGKASVVPSQEIDLHFTGDFHAITAANNLLAAAIDNHIYQGNELNIDEDSICFKRCLDVNDRSLRKNFNITAASEVMAIFCLAKDYDDLRRRLGNILCCFSKDGKPIYAKDFKVDGAMALLLKQAFYPNLVQTLEENPVLIHGGPFANIAHGCSSINSINLGLSLADYVVTEAGFGSDLGSEKFFDIVCRNDNIIPNYVVLVVTNRALQYSGYNNLKLHIDNLKQFKVPFCVAINQFKEDKVEELDKIKAYCHDLGVEAIVTNSYEEGSSGSIELAKYITEVGLSSDNSFTYLYDNQAPVEEKIATIIQDVYNVPNIDFSPEAISKMNLIDSLKLNHYPVCIAKTQYAYPEDLDRVNVKNIIIQTGSEMIIVLLDNIITMPGLPKHPNFENMQ